MANLNDTNLPANYSKVLFEEKCYDLAPEHLGKVYDAVFTGAADLLKANKSQDKPVALTFRDVKQNLVAASIVAYRPNKDDNSKPGNYSLVWTFDESDIPEGAILIDFSDPQTHSFFRAVAGEKYGMAFKDIASLTSLVITSLEQLKKWLDENANEKTEVSVECDGLFVARVAVEGGEKVFALEPDGEIKNIIKDDASIER